MTDVMRSGTPRHHRGDRSAPVAPCYLTRLAGVTYSNICGVFVVRAFPAGPSGSCAVMKLAPSRPCMDADVLVRVQDPRRIVGERDVGEEVLGDVLGEVHVVAGQDDGARLGQAHDGHLAARRVARPALDHHAAVAEQIQVALELIHLERVGQRLAEVVAQARDVARDVRARRSRFRPGRVLHLVPLHEEGRVGELADVAAVVEVHVADGDVLDVVRRQADLLELGVDGHVGPRSGVRPWMKGPQ